MMFFSAASCTQRGDAGSQRMTINYNFTDVVSLKIKFTTKCENLPLTLHRETWRWQSTRQHN